MQCLRRSRWAGRLLKPTPSGWRRSTPACLARWLSSDKRVLCWMCDRELTFPAHDPGFVCPCEREVVLPPSTHNYFTIMQCPVSFTVDVAGLKNRYRQLQRKLHPDQYTNKPQDEQEYSAQQSSLVNKAYSTLLNSYTRGLYLLKLHGVTIDEQDSTTAAADMDFLEEVMAINEEIHEKTPRDSRLRVLRSRNRVKLQQCIAEVERCFEQGDISSAKDGLSRMKYFVNIEEDLIELLDAE